MVLILLMYNHPQRSALEQEVLDMGGVSDVLMRNDRHLQHAIVAGDRYKTDSPQDNGAVQSRL